MPHSPFRLGSTSYVIPADILPNVRHLGPSVDDIELVLFEVDDQKNLPSPKVIEELIALAAEHALTYTVHLPLDLKLAASHDLWNHPSMEIARQVIATTRPLTPWAYVVHLDGSDIESDFSATSLVRWRDQAARSLEVLGSEAGDWQLLAVENLENYDPAAFVPLLDRLPISLCIDVGHFMKNQRDPMPFTRTYLERARVVHLHGVKDGRDHRGLEWIAPDLLAHVIDLLLERRYRGVLTIEVFTERHFFPGLELVLSLLDGRRKAGAKLPSPPTFRPSGVRR